MGWIVKNSVVAAITFRQNQVFFTVGGSCVSLPLTQKEPTLITTTI